MAKSKHYKMGVGIYYFNIKSGIQNIVISRASKEDAVNSFLMYKKVGKDAEWLGCWNGKKFDENTAPSLKDNQ